MAISLKCVLALARLALDELVLVGLALVGSRWISSGFNPVDSVD